MLSRLGPSWKCCIRPSLTASAGALTFLCAAHAQDAPAAPPAPVPSAPAQLPAAPSALGSISGEVIDTDGAMIAGAKITLATPDHPSPHTAESDINGHFAFRDLAPGPYTITVALQGFTPATQTGTLLAGQSLDLNQIALSLAAVHITVQAITPEQAALEELHTEEHQRLVGVLPNFFVSYSWTAPPLSSRQKFTLAWKNASDPGNIALSATVAAVQQADDAFPGYHQGAKGYFSRFGADYANLWAGTFMGGAILPTLFHQDPRYFYKGTGTVRQRALYAISRAVITRGDNGKPQPNFSGILGDLSAGAISNIYYPASDRQGATLTIENGFLGIAGDAMNGLVQEFVLPRFTTKGKKDAPAADEP